MAMSGEIRVKTSSRFRHLYNELKNVVIRDMHELFFLCACVGYTRRRSLPLGTSKDDRFWSKTISPDEWACYYAMIIKDHSMDFRTISSDEEVIARIEEYANAGMEILLEEVLRDYLLKGSSEPRIDMSSIECLPREFLFHIRETLAKAGV